MGDIDMVRRVCALRALAEPDLGSAAVDNVQSHFTKQNTDHS